MKVKEISVFFPAFNEAENISRTITQAQIVLKNIAHRYEIIVIDDGSEDETGNIVKNLMQKNKQLKLTQHQPNLGYGAALKTGISQSKYKLICYTDSDGQFDFSEIKKFLLVLDRGADMVIGFRIKRTDNLYRRFMARILRLSGIILFGINVKDVDCGFKLFKREVRDKIGPLKTASAITETELVTRAKRAGFKVAEVGVHHHSRSGGEQTGGRLSVVLKASLEGLKLWWLLLKETK